MGARLIPKSTWHAKLPRHASVGLERRSFSLSVCDGHVQPDKKQGECRSVLYETKRLTSGKIWEGISLVSDARWSSKKLDNQERINEAIAYIHLTINVFDYLHKPIVHGNMRDAYNRVHKELGIFQDAINFTRAEKGEAALCITALWSEFIKSVFVLPSHYLYRFTYKCQTQGSF